MGAWSIEEGRGPLVGVALHGGHQLRPEIERRMRLAEEDRRREEDPGTDAFARAMPTRVIVHRSRFEVDLNRPVDTAIYATPEQAWGLQVWDEPLPAPVISRSVLLHRAFYEQVRRLLARVASDWGSFLVCDLHSYNHRRAGPLGPPAEAGHSPDINIGTGSMDRARWAPVVEGFMAALRQGSFAAGLPLDVRENVNFRGAYFSKWVHSTFPASGCAIAIEVKKIYMDEWSGQVSPDVSATVTRLLGAAAREAVAALPSQILPARRGAP